MVRQGYRFAKLTACACTLALLSACASHKCRDLDASCNDWAAVLLFSRISVARDIYITDNIANTVYAYSIDHRTGLVTLIGQTATQTLPRGVVYHPAGFLYVANETSGSISIYRTSASAPPVLVSHFSTGGGTPSALAISSTGGILYATRQGSSVVNSYLVDQSTGLLTSTGFTGATDANTNQIVLHPTLPYAYTGAQTTATSYAFNLNSNGSFSTAANVNTPNDAFYPLLLPGGAFMVLSNNTGTRLELYSISSSNGSRTALSPSFFAPATAPGVSTSDLSGTTIYVCSPLANTLRVITVNGSTGQPQTEIQQVPVSGGPYALAFDPTGTYLYAAAGATLYAFRRDSSGRLTQIAAATPGSAAFNKLTIAATTAF